MKFVRRLTNATPTVAEGVIVSTEGVIVSTTPTPGSSEPSANPSCLESRVNRAKLHNAERRAERRSQRRGEGIGKEEDLGSEGDEAQQKGGEIKDEPQDDETNSKRVW